MTKSLVQPQVAGSGARGEETRRRLIAAAIELVAQQGWEQVTTRQIAARAGVNQALINYHFGTKEQLLRSALGVALRRELAAPARALLEAPRFVDGVVELLGQLAELDAAGPGIRFSMTALARAPRDEAVRQVMADLLAELRELLARGIVTAQRRGEIPASVDPDGAATLLGAALDGLGLHQMADPALDVASAAHALRDLLTGGTEEA